MEVGDERVRVLKGWETGEIVGIMHNGYYFAVEKGAKGRKSRKTGMGARNASYGRHDVWTTLAPSPYHSILSKERRS